MTTQLTKTSTSDELRNYFNAVLNIAKNNEKFPINLDEVWMLVYAKKSNAVRELKKSFIEGEDYIIENESVLQNEHGEKQARENGRFAEVTYHLSLSCLEYFIARKVRPVFEVYRQVFHKTAQQQEIQQQVPTTFREALLLAAQQQETIEQQERQLIEQERQLIEQKGCLIEQQATIENNQVTISHQEEELKAAAPKVNYYDTTLQSRSTMTMTQVAKSIGLTCQQLTANLRKAGIIFRQSGQWLLREPYSHWHLHATRTQTYTRSDGSICSSLYTVWNERGRLFIVTLHNNAYNARDTVDQLKTNQSKRITSLHETDNKSTTNLDMTHVYNNSTTQL